MNSISFHKAPRRKRIAAVLLSIGFALAFALCPGCQAGKKDKGKPGDKDAFDVGDVVKAIEEIIKESAAKPVAGFPDLTGVTVELKADRAKEGGGQIKLLIFTIGAKRSSEGTTSLTLELKPPKPGKPTALSSTEIENFKHALAAQIQLAQLAFLQAEKSSDYLKTNKVELEVSFVVKWEVSGGVDTATLIPVELTGSGKLNQGKTHTIKLTYEKKD